MFSSHGKWKMEVERRVQAGRAALSSVSKHVIWNRNISVKVKKVIFEAIFKSKMMYGGEVWWANKNEVGKMETVENDFIRWVTGFTRKDRMHVTELRKQVGMRIIEG